jgi:hypothetical protein
LHKDCVISGPFPSQKLDAITRLMLRRSGMRASQSESSAKEGAREALIVRKAGGPDCEPALPRYALALFRNRLVPNRPSH